MKVRNLRASAVAAVGGFLLLVTASNIYAVPTLSFSVDGGVAVTCAVTGGGCSSSPGSVSFISNLTSPQGGAFSVFTMGLVSPGSNMDLFNVSVTSMSTTGSHTLQIMFSETGFVIPGGAFASFGGTISGPATSTVTASAYFSMANTLFGTGLPGMSAGTLIATSGTFAGTPPPGTPFSQSITGGGPPTAPFSLTQVLNITASGPGTTIYSGDFALAVNPEPSSFVLMSSILLFAGVAVRQRRARES